MKKIFIVAAVIFSSQTSAQQVAADSVGQLHEVVITTNKYPKKQSSTGKVVSVIDASMLQQMAGRSLGEVLNTASGTTVNGANNTAGTNQRVSIRGAADGNVLLLIDGVPVNDPSVISNYFDLNLVDLSSVERIEILKGGHSTLYGSDAVAGVINIITKKTATRTLELTGGLKYGSYGSIHANAVVAGKNKSLFYRVGGNRISSRGFSAALDSTGISSFDKDGFLQKGFSAEASFNATPQLQLRAFGRYSNYETDVDAAAFTDDKDFIAKAKNGQAGLGFVWKQKQGQLQMNYHLNYIDRFYLDDSADKVSFGYYSRSSYAGNTHFAELYQSFNWNNWEWLAGTDFRYDFTNQDYFAVSLFGPYQQPDLNKTAYQFSTYSSLVFNKNQWNIETGGRWNHHNAYGNNFTYTINPSCLIGEKIKLYGNIATAYKVPSLFQLYDVFAGNNNLRPETSRTAEAGFTMYASHARLRLTGFSRTSEDAIQYTIVNPATYEGHYSNANHQQNYGAEAEVNFRNDKWMVNANYTFTKGRVSSSFTESGEPLVKDTVYNNLYRVPEHSANVFASYIFSKNFSITGLLKVSGSRLEPVYASAPLKLDGYYTVDLSALYKLRDFISIFTDLKNLTDQVYYDVAGYNSRRFNFTSGIRFYF